MIDAQAVRLLLDCASVFGNDTELSARTLAERLAQLEESPWQTYRYGKPISADQTGRLLRRFGIKPRKTRSGNVYRRTDVEAAATRYSPTPPDPSSTLHPSSTHVPIPRDTGEVPEPGPAEAQAVEVNATAAESALPPGWPSNTPKPPWWPEFLDCLGSIRLLAAREQMCGDPTCGFSVAILWTDGKTAEWSCPKCGRTSGPIVQQKCRRCGSTQYHDVPIHNGKSIRRDCARCGRFLDFPAWHGTQ